MSGADSSERVLLRPRVDRVFECLSNHQRRWILLLLREGVVETEADVMNRGGCGRESGRLALTHTHLPKLEAAGYVEWNRETGGISKGPQFDEIERFVTLVEQHADELPHDWP